MATAPDRTAPIRNIRRTPLNGISDIMTRNITHTVAIPGLTMPAQKGGGPLTVKRTYTVHEIAEEWVSVVVDYEFGDEPTVYGNHPAAVGPLREILPDAYPQRPFPKLRRAMRDGVVSMLAHHDLGGWVVMPIIDDRTLEIHPPAFHSISGFGTIEYRLQRWIAAVREYFPYQADLWWDEANDVIRIRPRSETQELPVVQIA